MLLACADRSASGNRSCTSMKNGGPLGPRDCEARLWVDLVRITHRNTNATKMAVAAIKPHDIADLFSVIRGPLCRDSSVWLRVLSLSKARIMPLPGDSSRLRLPSDELTR